MMDFWRWLFFEFLGDWFTIITFSVIGIIMSDVVIHVYRYGWEVLRFDDAEEND
jgi:hypothetical protein